MMTQPMVRIVPICAALAACQILYVETAGAELARPVKSAETIESIPIGCYPDGIDPVSSNADGVARFLSDVIVWTGDGQQGVDGTAQPTHLTYSFPDDGTDWGLRPPFGPTDLSAALIDGFGDLDLGREYIRQAIAAWAALTGLSYDEVADDNSPMDNDIARTPNRGDIRIGGQDLAGTALAYNAFPNRPPAEGDAGGDMVINTQSFAAVYAADPETSFRLLRHVVAHEHGHGLGYFHVAPCTATKIMEPGVPFGGIEPLGIDEKRGGGRNYGDDFAGNADQMSAVDLGVLTGTLSPGAARTNYRSARERDVSLNGAAGPGGTGNDWYRFTLQRRASVEIQADPTGGTYDVGAVGPDCTVLCDIIEFEGASPPCPPNVADEAGDIRLELYDSVGLIASADSQPAGGIEIISTSLLVGEYFLRVIDMGPNPFDNGIVQLYDLSVLARRGFQGVDGPAPPTAVAGLNKRCTINTGCYFIGDLLSHANDPNATGPLSFDWDLNGDGVFEVIGNARPVISYTKPDVYAVSLRVTDSIGSTHTNTITVTVSDSPGRCCFSGVQPPQLCADVTQLECSFLQSSTWTPGTTCAVPCEPEIIK